MIRSALLIAAIAAVTSLHGPMTAPAMAQGLFAPRILVNDRAITEYELQQRIQMLRLFQTPGDVVEQARTALIEDRLRSAAAAAIGITASAEQIRLGMEEFASRANLTAEQFLEALAQAGVEAESFRDFVAAGLVWREVVRARFGAKVNITAAEIDRAIANSDGDPSTRVLVSEIVIPVGEAAKSSVMALARSVREDLTSDSAFATAARTYSSAASSGKGGKVDWIPASALPAVVASQLLRLQPGEISQPIDMGSAIGIFQLRDLQKASSPNAGNTLDYAIYLLPGGKDAPAAAARLRGKLSTCDDLYAIAKGQPEDRLTFESRPVNQVPGNIALQLAAMDPGESIDYPQGAGAHAFLMLCARNPVGAAAASREQVQADLANQRLAALADIYMEEMRREAFIREP